MSRVGSLSSVGEDGGAGVAVRFVTKLNELKLAAATGAERRTGRVAAKRLVPKSKVGCMDKVCELDESIGMPRNNILKVLYTRHRCCGFDDVRV
jgi:hypothetical protein